MLDVAGESLPVSLRCRERVEEAVQDGVWVRNRKEVDLAVVEGAGCRGADRWDVVPPQW